MRFYRQIGFNQELFGGEKTVRLKCLMKRIQDGALDSNLRIR